MHYGGEFVLEFKALRFHVLVVPWLVPVPGRNAALRDDSSLKMGGGG